MKLYLLKKCGTIAGVALDNRAHTESDLYMVKIVFKNN